METKDVACAIEKLVYPTEEMFGWAQEYMNNRKPDVTIGENYLYRWWIIPRNDYMNLYLHHTVGSDDDRALHDHPWDNMSYILDGEYIEITKEGEFLRQAGDVIVRPANTLHRLVIPDGKTATSLFYTGPKYREWGFECPQGWKPWREFCDPENRYQKGPGCGD